MAKQLCIDISDPLADARRATAPDVVAWVAPRLNHCVEGQPSSNPGLLVDALKAAVPGIVEVQLVSLGEANDLGQWLFGSRTLFGLWTTPSLGPLGARDRRAKLRADPLALLGASNPPELKLRFSEAYLMARAQLTFQPFSRRIGKREKRTLTATSLLDLQPAAGGADTIVAGRVVGDGIRKDFALTLRIRDQISVVKLGDAPGRLDATTAVVDAESSETRFEDRQLPFDLDAPAIAGALVQSLPSQVLVPRAADDIDGPGTKLLLDWQDFDAGATDITVTAHVVGPVPRAPKVSLHGSFERLDTGRMFRGRVSASADDIQGPVSFVWALSRGVIVGESSATIVVEVPDDGATEVSITATAIDGEPTGDISGQRTFQLVKSGELPTR